MNHAWTCRCCGRQFDTLPLDFACEAPHQWAQIPETERQHRGKLDSDVCIIDAKDIFVRGCIEIPIIGLDQKFVWGAWVSVSKESFARIIELWDVSSIKDEAPKLGSLCNNIALYPTTLNLKANLHIRGGKNRPSIELEPTNHPLVIEQRQGISIERAEEIAALLSLRH